MLWMWELDYKESWAPKNWCFWTVVLGRTLENPLDCKEIKPVHPKGDQSWVFIGRTDVEAETPILWPPDAKSWLIWKDPDAWKDWALEEGTTEDDLILGGSKITADGDCSHEIKRHLLLGSKVMTNLDSILESRHYFVNKGLSSQTYSFSSGHVFMWELEYKESWVLKNWCF